MKIEVKKLKKTFSQGRDLNCVFEDVNITFKDSKIYGLVGLNGSGKSVFLKILCGLYNPTDGKVLYDGEDIFKNKTFPKDTRALIEKPGFLPDLTGLDNLLLLSKIQNKITKEQIIDTMKQVNLDKQMNKKYSKYSLGMKQKLGIAQVLMEDPKVIILDEPFNGIEVKTADKIREILKQEKEKGKIIILASHISKDISELVDVLYEFNDGKVKKINKSEII